MMKELFQAIMQVGIFSICSQAFLHLGPNGSYEKYLKILVGVMILIQIFLPIFRLFPEAAGDVEERMAYFQEQLEEAMGEAREIADRAEERLEKEVLEEAEKETEDLSIEIEKIEIELEGRGGDEGNPKEME